ncbi:OLC1v1034051C1 [Oldenlandia corymbosa var. corymbosa]|uniref:Protein FAR1-RELATED SEQUENCE n=1 Tax=Oldenlandia corymbosa var. corymbosa TaxID=529605 RepID=A0AAV1CPT6_OLDCO|nr:OLC1v1034051C1 [Oldenlandia corymbosa var. corymbosa]
MRIQLFNDDDDAGRNQSDGNGTNGENGDTHGGELHGSDDGDDSRSDEDDAGDQDGKDDDGEETDDDSYDEDSDGWEYDEEEDDEESEEEDDELDPSSGSEDDIDDEPLMKHAREGYASDSFCLFRHEYEKSRAIHLDVLDERRLEFKYKATKSGQLHQPHSHRVHTKALEGIIDCCCNHFAVTGMLCSHALAVMDCLHIEEIPDRYLPKWRLKSWNQSSMEEQFSRKGTQLGPSSR